MAKFLNFGSLNLDLVYSVPNIVVPGETLSSFGMERFCGGKGLNQSIALAQAGAEVYHAGNIGFDGDILLETLKAHHVHTEYIRRLETTPTGNALIQVDQKGQNSIILFGGANQKNTEEYINQVLENFGPKDFIILQNEINGISTIIDRAYEKGMTIVWNPSPMNDVVFSCDLNKISLFVLNEIEGAQITGKTNYQEILTVMAERFPTAKVVLTLGSEGAIYWDGTKQYQHGIYDVKVVDTTAAGDTFLGFFTALLEKCGPEESLRLASVASSLAVSTAGASNSIPALNTVRTAQLSIKK